MKRRVLFGSMATIALSPGVVRAQPRARLVIGFLDGGSPEGMTVNLQAFRTGLGAAGFSDGKDVTIEYRWAELKYDRLAALAAELVRLPAAVIVASRGSASALAAKAATATIPIVFQTGSDPVKDGLVASLSQPGGNATGVTRLSTELMSKRLGLLQDMVPGATVISLLLNPTNLAAPSQIQNLQEAVRSRGLQLHVRAVGSEAELNTAFAIMAGDGTGALVVGIDPLLTSQRALIATLAAQYAIPAIFSDSRSVAAGGLMSYDASLTDSFRQVGVYVGRILKGEKPAALPVQQPTKLELLINLKAAKALGLAVPQLLLMTADEVIE